MVTATAKNAQIAVMYTISPSTLLAKYDAGSGARGNDCTTSALLARFHCDAVAAKLQKSWSGLCAGKSPRPQRERRSSSARPGAQFSESWRYSALSMDRTESNTAADDRWASRFF